MNLNEKFTFLISFSLFVASAYLFGFWGSFNINILELGGFSDIVKLAFYPLLKSLMIFFLGNLLGYLFSSPLVIKKDNESDINPPSLQTTKIRSFFKQYWQIITSLLLIITFIIFYFIPESNSKWSLIGAILPLVIIILTHNSIFKVFLQKHSIHVMLLPFVLYLIISSFGFGRIDANKIKNGSFEKIIDVSRSKLELNYSAEKPVVYLGRVNEIDILYESETEQIVLSKQSDDNPLFIINKRNNK